MRRHPPACYHGHTVTLRLPTARRPMRELACRTCGRIVHRWSLVPFGAYPLRGWPETATLPPQGVTFRGLVR